MRAAWMLFPVLALAADLESARDAQDRAALEAAVRELSRAAKNKPDNAAAHYRVALAESYLSEIALEQRDKGLAEAAAVDGIRAAERAVALDGGTAEHHRILGTLCGQAIPANLLLAFRYGKCALDSINRAIELDPKSWRAYLSRGVGNYYRPEAFGGGVGLGLADFRRALEVNPKAADAWLWLGIALRKQGRNGEARKALERSAELNPRRLWTKQQLEKTPPQ